MIVDTSVLVDALTDSGARGTAARRGLSQAGDRLIAPGLLAVEVLSALRRLAIDTTADVDEVDIAAALHEAERYGIAIEATPWRDVHRAWELARGSVRYTDGIFVALAERTGQPLITSDRRLSRSGAHVHCSIIPVGE